MIMQMESCWKRMKKTSGLQCYGRSITGVTVSIAAQWMVRTMAGTATEIDGKVVMGRVKMLYEVLLGEIYLPASELHHQGAFVADDNLRCYMGLAKVLGQLYPKPAVQNKSISWDSIVTVVQIPMLQ